MISPILTRHTPSPKHSLTQAVTRRVCQPGCVAQTPPWAQAVRANEVRSRLEFLQRPVGWACAPRCSLWPGQKGDWVREKGELLAAQPHSLKLCLRVRDGHFRHNETLMNRPSGKKTPLNLSAVISFQPSLVSWIIATFLLHRKHFVCCSSQNYLPWAGTVAQW